MTDQLKRLLESDLDFAGKNNYSSLHNYHSFPAKFPPGLPQLFIQELTQPGDIILDPMCGSGTTLIEALLNNRNAIGFDIDPLAALMSQVKCTHLNPKCAIDLLDIIIQNSQMAVQNKRIELEIALENKWQIETKEFVDYWFTKDAQVELLALLIEIEKLPNPTYKNFFKIVFSSIIITKSGGVSNALDLAHTRPHKAKVITNKNLPQQMPRLFKEGFSSYSSTKTIKPAILEFKKRALQNIKSLIDVPIDLQKPLIVTGNTTHLPLQDNFIDLVVTSPPYASNAIDYMRAHKFSLIWFGFPIPSLTKKRKEYIGAEGSLVNITNLTLPNNIDSIVNQLAEIDSKKALSVKKYYLENYQIFYEVFRVLKPGKFLIYVVGSSVIRGIDIDIANCLKVIGESIGFSTPKIGIRNINRDRRMLPISRIQNQESSIEKRMQNEYVIGFQKPE